MRAVIEKIKSASSVAILPHVNEDADALGSCFAFKRMLEKAGKEAVIYVSGSIEDRLSFMGTDYIVYNNPASHNHDLCVCLDCGELERITERKSLFNEIGNTVNIDHHFTNTLFADANYVDGKASATGEILAELFRAMDFELDDKTAENLYTAICSDTGCFKYSSVTPKTMRIAADLLEYDFDHAEIARLLFDTETIAAMRFKADISGGIKSFEGGKISLVTADEKEAKKYGIDKADIPNLVDIPRRIAGTEIAVCIKRTDKGFRVNLRSNGDADVATVAAALGGGGHIKAAGATVHTETAEEAEKLVIDECKKALRKI